jgi:predicted nucleic acid binding AN1-type Zn finger protein
MNNTQVVLDQIVKSIANIKLQNIIIETKEQIIKPTINKCSMCNKKTGLLGFSCQCGGNFCTLHRHLESHNCTAYNTIKNKSLENLAKQNQKIIADKIIKI